MDACPHSSTPMHAQFFKYKKRAEYTWHFPGQCQYETLQKTIQSTIFAPCVLSIYLSIYIYIVLKFGCLFVHACLLLHCSDLHKTDII